MPLPSDLPFVASIAATLNLSFYRVDSTRYDLHHRNTWLGTILVNSTDDATAWFFRVMVHRWYRSPNDPGDPGFRVCFLHTDDWKPLLVDAAQWVKKVQKDEVWDDSAYLDIALNMLKQEFKLEPTEKEVTTLQARASFPGGVVISFAEDCYSVTRGTDLRVFSKAQDAVKQVVQWIESKAE